MFTLHPPTSPVKKPINNPRITVADQIIFRRNIPKKCFLFAFLPIHDSIPTAIKAAAIILASTTLFPSIPTSTSVALGAINKDSATTTSIIKWSTNHLLNQISSSFITF